MGVGEATWKQYFSQMKKIKLKSVAMLYTKDFNVTCKMQVQKIVASQHDPLFLCMVPVVQHHEKCFDRL